MRRFMIICALLGACIIAFAAQQSKANQPQKPAQQPKVDFTVNYAVESNYNTEDLRKQLFDKKDTTVMVVAHRGDWHGTAENSLHAIQKDIEGKWALFFFYPADFTFVCPTELEDLQSKYAELQSMGVEVFGVSTDSHFVHKAWHDTS